MLPNPSYTLLDALADLREERRQHQKTTAERDELRARLASSEKRFDCHAGPGTTEPACEACVTCLLRENAELTRKLAANNSTAGDIF